MQAQFRLNYTQETIYFNLNAIIKTFHQHYVDDNFKSQTFYARRNVVICCVF